MQIRLLLTLALWMALWPVLLPNRQIQAQSLPRQSPATVLSPTVSPPVLSNTATTMRLLPTVDGQLPDRPSVNPALSADGRMLVFASRATNLLPGEPSNALFDFWQIYAYDRAQNQLERVSVSAGGQPGNASSGGSPPAISADGRLIAFASRASNLVVGDTNNASDIFVYDLVTKNSSRLSITHTGAQANRESYLPALSADGNVVAFVSQANNLVPGDTNNAADVFVHDRQTGQTSRVSVASGGSQADGASSLAAPALSADGRYVAFASAATNLVPGDTNNAADIFVHDRQTGQTSRVSVASGGSQADGASTAPAISADGRYVAFLSSATNLASGPGGDTSSGIAHVYLHDRQTNQTVRISTTHDGQVANGESYAPALSPDGRFVAFASVANNLVPDEDANATTGDTVQLYLHDGLSGHIERVSVSASGVSANGVSWRPTLAGYGRYVGFESTATTLTATPGSGLNDLYLHDRGPQATGAFTLTGHMADADGAPLAGIPVTVGRRFPRQATTGANGRFTVSNLPAGDYVVDADAPNHLLHPSFPQVVSVGEATPALDVLAFACLAPSGLDLCRLQPGDILLESTPSAPDWPAVGGTYFTRATLFVGINEDTNTGTVAPRVVQIDNETGDSAAIVERALSETEVWCASSSRCAAQNSLLDWTVIRPQASAALVQRAVRFAQAVAADEDAHYGFFAEDTQAPVDLADTTYYYDAKLIYQAYAQAGPTLAQPGSSLLGANNGSLAGWITPDDLYWSIHSDSSTQVQRRTAGSGERSYFVNVTGPVYLALVSDTGARIGYSPATPATLAPRAYIYSGPDALVQSIGVGRLATDQLWEIEVTGRSSGDYRLVWGEVAPNGVRNMAAGTIRAGETIHWTLAEPDYIIYLPLIGR